MEAAQASFLAEIVRRLGLEFEPEAIVLFGSHAWGTPTADSDLDLLVIVPESRETPLLRARCAHRCLRGIPVATDVLVKTRGEVESFRRVPASLEAEILGRGKVIYERRENGASPGLAHV